MVSDSHVVVLVELFKHRLELLSELGSLAFECWSEKTVLQGEGIWVKMDVLHLP